MQDSFPDWLEWLEMYLWWPIERIIEKLFNWGREVKWFWQRGRWGYSDRDLWSMDDWLAEIIPNALRDLAKCTHTYPREGTRQGKTMKKWQEFLRKKAQAFDDYRTYDDPDIHKFPFNGTKAEVQKYGKESVERYQKACNEIQELFSPEIFGHLWD